MVEEIVIKLPPHVGARGSTGSDACTGVVAEIDGHFHLDRTTFITARCGVCGKKMTFNCMKKLKRASEMPRDY